MPPIYKKVLMTVVGLIGAGLIFSGGFYAGYQKRPAISQVTGLANIESGEPSTVDFTPFWRAWNVVNERYVDAHASTTASTTANQNSNQIKVWGAIGGMVSSLGDPYSVFFPPAEKKSFDDEIRGNFGGVGIEVGMKDGALTVIAPLPDSPAKRAGVLSGDKILQIDKTPTAKLPVDVAARLIRGAEGTVVRLTLSRQNVAKVIELAITREVIAIPTVKTELRPDQVFVISLYNFSAPSTALFRDALRKFAESGTDKLILDLRGNPGGYLDAAVDMASWFLPAGTPVVQEVDKGDIKIYRSRGYDVFNQNLKMVILVDQGSASAAEILAGALSEYGIATLIGERTFGKGSVQELISLTANTSLKITIARWLTPKGHSISDQGLEPAIKVGRLSEDAQAGKDPQLAKAVQFLLNK